jgi:aldehyde:ferredoxin oxidoreductase
MYGYHGKILQVDLSARETKDVKLEEEDLRNFVGGAGLAARLLYPLMKKDLDPLSPENPLIFMTGPFTGTAVPFTGRHTICAKSPLTGVWGESSSGGFFGVSLKSTGYDGVMIVGRSDKPVYLLVHDGAAEIKDASHLWAKGVYQTKDVLMVEVGNKRARISAIGQGGENLVRYASIMNDDGRAAGRCGLGAVMGVKKLKAIVVHGDKRPRVANSGKLKENIKAALVVPITELTALSTREMFREFGTIGYLDMAMYLSDAPAKYFSKSVFPVEDIDGKALRQKYTVTPIACSGCPIGCGRLTEYGKHGIDKVDGPAYETVAALGPCCMNFDLDSIIHANHLCNDYGIDTISTGVSIAFVMYLYEKGVLTKDKIGMEMNWGDSKAIVGLVEKIAKREGAGDILAEGVKRIAEKFGVSQDEAAHVKGLELPMHDPRAFFGDAVDYTTSPRGACHTKADYYMVDMGRGVSDAGIMPGDRFESSENKGAMVAKYQNLRDLFNSLPLCIFSPIISPEHIAGLLNAVTGWDFNADSIMMTGERSFNLKRVINSKLGITKEDDKLPKIAITPLSEGTSQGKKPDMETLLRGHYKERGWDVATGKPTKEKLQQLGLSEAIKDIY